MSRDHDIAVYTPFASLHYRRGGPDGGGAELQAVILARALAARGRRVAHIVFPVEDPAPVRPNLTLVERAPYQGKRRWLGAVAEAFAIWRSMHRADAAVYVFRAGRMELFVGALFGLLRRRRILYSGANDFDFELEPGEGLRGALYKLGLKRTDAIVTQTPRQRELALDVVPGHPRVVTIPSFVEAAKMRGGEPDGFIWIGRLTPYKRPLEYAELAAAVPEARFRAVFFPDTATPPDLPEALERRAAELPNLELLGRLPRGEVLELIERSHAVVSTSTSEGMPNVFLEAWAQGVPVVSLELDPGGRIAEQRLGLLADGSRERLAQAVRELLNDEALRSELGRNAREFVQRAHDTGMIADQWFAVLAGLLKPGSA